MSLTKRNILRRTEDAGSAGCPPLSAGCTTNPEGHDLTPAQASSLSLSLAASTTSASSHTSVATSARDTSRDGGMDPQEIGGIIVIAFLVLAFTSLICYIAFGARGERCCCRGRKDRKRKTGQLERGKSVMPMQEGKQESELQLLHTA